MSQLGSDCSPAKCLVGDDFRPRHARAWGTWRSPGVPVDDMVMGALLVAWGQRANVCKPGWLVYPPLIMRESSLVFHMWKFRPTWGLLCFVMTAVCSSHTTWSRKKEWNQVTECDCDRSKIEASPTAVRIPISAKREISN